MTSNYPVEQKSTTNGNIYSDQPLLVRIIAHFFSFIFHPLFIPLYATWYLAFVHPYYFVGFAPSIKLWVLLRVCLNMIFFPALTVFLLKAIGFIDSIFLKTQKDRIIPIIASNLFFFWMYLVFRNQQEIPTILTSFTFGVFLASSFALLANIYIRISLHAIGVGGLLGLFLVITYTNPAIPVTLPLMASILLTGLICTSRMIVGKHTQAEIYFGIIIGLVSQILASWFLL